MSIDSKYRDGEETARGWKAKKYYLSDEAIALLVAHCKGTPYTMSAWIDMTIKRELDNPAERFLREQHPVAEVAKVLGEGAKQLEELTKPAVPPMKHTDIRSEQLPRAAYEKAGGFDGVVARAVIVEESKTSRPPRDPREPLGAFQEVKQPAKKDFKVDL